MRGAVRSALCNAFLACECSSKPKFTAVISSTHTCIFGSRGHSDLHHDGDVLV